MKLRLFVITLFTTLGLSSQIRIGQPIDETIYFLNHIVRMKRNWNIEKKYRNGEIKEVIIHKRNQYFYDFNLRTDSAERLIADSNGNYAYSLGQFPELSLEFIKEKFDDEYKDYKVDDLYFTEDFSHYMKLSLIDNYATIVYNKVQMESFPKSMKNRILKKKEIAAEKQKEAQKKSDYIEKLENGYFDISDFEPKFYKKLFDDVNLRAKLLLYKDINNLNLKEELKIKETFTLELRVRKYKKIAYDINLIPKTKNNSKFSPLHMERRAYRFPSVTKKYEGKEYQLNRHAKINLNYDVTVGLLEIKKKRSKIQTEKNMYQNQKSTYFQLNLKKHTTLTMVILKQ